MSAPTRGRVALLYDCTYPHVPGGGQKRLFEIFRRLVAKGWQVDWYGLKAWEGDALQTIEGIRFIAVAKAEPLYGPDGKRLIAQTFRYGMAIAGFPRVGGYDIVHMGQWPYFHFFPVRLFAWFGGARISVDWWEVWAENWRTYYGSKGYLGMALEWLCSRMPARLVAISETGRQQLERLGVDSKKIDVIHNGIDFSAISTAQPDDESSDLIYLGRLQPHKNVNLLIEALVILKQRGLILRLTIIGDGPERKSLEALAKRLNVADQISWAGAIENDADVYAKLRASRIFVHPSTKEGGGSITSLEANAAGLPVVAFAVPGGISPELIIEGRNGHWVAKVDAEALADGIDHTINVLNFAKHCPEAIKFSKRFDWAGIANQYDAVFCQAISRKRGS
jgi:L-malate glycosyltransferase